MRFLTLMFGFAVIVHVKCQLDVEDILYGEDDEEDDQNDVTTTTTTARPRMRRRTTFPPIVPLVNLRQRQELINTTFVAANLTNTNTTGANMANHTFVLQPANGTFFGAVLASTAEAGATTERVHYVLGQVANIFNSVGGLNVTGIVDQALGIRNSQIARPLVTGILNVVLCNPFTFSNNNCQRRRAEK